MLEHGKKIKKGKHNLKPNQKDNCMIINVDLSVEFVDIIEGISHLGFRSTDFVESLNSKYKSLYPVGIIIKQFLRRKGCLNHDQGIHIP